MTLSSLQYRSSFQSTPSAWRETIATDTATDRLEDFNPLPPHGGRLRITSSQHSRQSFQSTPSAWRETGKIFDGLVEAGRISIHSLRMEGDISGAVAG